jgi:hypothetical protein
MKSKKGLLGLGQLAGIVLVLVTIGIMLVVGLRVESDLQDDFTENSTEWNAAEDTMEGLDNVAENQGLLGTIIIFGVILGVVVMAFAVGRRR